MSITYDRILLVKHDFSERVTIDINLVYERNGVLAETPGLAICEFKQPRLDRRSPAIEALIANVVIIAVPELLGGVWLSAQPNEHSITYERIELIHPGRRAELLLDLEERTGLSILGVTIHELNFLNDTAQISIQVPADDRASAL
ncbi:MAG: hypothetical protein ACI81L_002263 [Verrucomicrobiales bacterium]